MITLTNESQILTKDNSCKCKCKFDEKRKKKVREEREKY